MQNEEIKIKTWMGRLPCCLLFGLLACLSISSSAMAQEAGDARYPKIRSTAAGTVVVHTPQITQWTKFRELEGLLALEVALKGSEQPAVGSVSFSANSNVDLEHRTVRLTDIRITKLVFPQAANEDQLADLVRSVVSTEAKTVPLDVILRGLPDQMMRKLRVKLRLDPPTILVATRPTVLMLLDGEPVLQKIQNTALSYVANTDWHLFFDHDNKRWYVLNEQAWQVSDSLDQPWQSVSTLPADFSNLPGDEYWEVVRQQVPARKPAKQPPVLLVSQSTAVLVVIDGQPRFKTIPGAGLEYLENTNNDVFRHQDTYYLLIANLWFQSQSPRDSWRLASKLPPNLGSIPLEHEKGHVLAFVPGTQEARVAALEGEIPHKVRVEEGIADTLELSYQGTPQFVSIQGTNLRRASNTKFQVVQYGNRYYLCLDAAWFESSNPINTWKVAHDIPQEIYRIPAGNPLHNTTYVRRWYADPGQDVVNTLVYVHTAGYTQPLDVDIEYQRHGAYYPGDAWGMYPSYGYWGRQPGFFMYPHHSKYGSTYNPETGTVVQQSLAYSADGRRRSMSVSVSFGNRQKEQLDLSLDGIDSVEQLQIAPGNSDLYADSDGGIYRRTEDGWQRNDGQGWEDSGPDQFDESMDRWWQARTLGQHDFDCQQDSCD